ncbi:hypothetical protein ACJX0J_035534, partial [Zea mays]
MTHMTQMTLEELKEIFFLVYFINELILCANHYFLKIEVHSASTLGEHETMIKDQALDDFTTSKTKVLDYQMVNFDGQFKYWTPFIMITSGLSQDLSFKRWKAEGGMEGYFMNNTTTIEINHLYNKDEALLREEETIFILYIYRHENKHVVDFPDLAYIDLSTQGDARDLAGTQT